MSQHSFDVLVIGTGGGGSVAARKCAAAGKRVAIVDALPYGGTCALRGCDPKKVLVGAAETVARSRQLLGHGVAQEATVSWPELMAFKRTFTEPVPEKKEAGFQKAGIHPFHGVARFTGPHTVQVGADVLEAKQFVIATGARAQPLGIPGEELLLDSTDFMELPELPADLTFVGGGYIAFEFAHLAARAGAKVRILHRGARPLENFEPELVEHLLIATREAGIEVLLNTEVKRLSKTPDGQLRLHAETDGQPREFPAGLAIHAAGREPALAELNLEAAGVAYTRQGVTVNEYLQSTSHPDVYAAGDAAASGLPLTPVAGKASHVAAANLLEGNHQVIDYGLMPSAVFAHPVLASVGLGEAEATRQGLKFQVKHDVTTGWFTSKRLRTPRSAFKVLIEEETDLILGAHLLGPNAEEVINLFMLAMHARLPAAEVRKLIFAYPTASSDIIYML
ncbi:pyridine nucleotide-disulphide oxidoreductase dimerisation region [Hymenobacter roseosalivarius DSM 11622]|uniref:Pyridine nucleotide-disulphide oxidoreductase dimerisation region n=1 Tax=Hymenobacter roseosalivarius DSM 11622 TaxID=645990 RepID=A0A1W1UJE4_9BACT|nr:NAD(P)/FAD-dependent oxidoreductase [Hymenobacter roseosalivarius]SMB81159.1 pyridine nucleotide-disulphide oxidoreductase dimerisation region [Hymenobacter roseosalivarius DSM 11622]